MRCWTRGAASCLAARRDLEKPLEAIGGRCLNRKEAGEMEIVCEGEEFRSRSGFGGLDYQRTEPE